MIHIRPEQPEDIPAVHLLNVQAFETPDEADLVDRLREDVDPFISLVAVDDSLDGGEVIGHILFTSVTIEPAVLDRRLCGLAPMAVLPERQRQGVGSLLVEAGLSASHAAGFHAAVVLGHPEFYPRFGFKPASTRGLTSRYAVRPEYFMVVELVEGGLQGVHGQVHYHPIFDALD